VTASFRVFAAFAAFSLRASSSLARRACGLIGTAASAAFTTPGFAPALIFNWRCAITVCRCGFGGSRNTHSRQVHLTLEKYTFAIELILISGINNDCVASLAQAEKK
jgi:hypothetical protein